MVNIFDDIYYLIRNKTKYGIGCFESNSTPDTVIIEEIQRLCKNYLKENKVEVSREDQ